jgi:uroporphyrinogen III methyltransferase/synthase
MMKPAGTIGTVFLVGAGPGDTGLITVKGADCIRQAEVVVYDNLVNEALLQKYARPEAELIYVGKEASEHTLPQPEINKLLVRLAQTGRVVCRLKGGDPYVFGRGSEEALELVQNGIPFEVVPGITAAVAVPAYAGIPLTDRSCTSTAALITGHEDPNKKESSIDWAKLATACGTLVFYMGVKNLPNIVQELITHGRTPETPIALIRHGTYNSQETVSGTLIDIVEKVRAKGLKPPAIIIVGEVVSLREKLRWFDLKPLFGKKVLVTRSRLQASLLREKLEQLGAIVREFPTIDIRPVSDLAQLDAAIMAIESFGWLIFTSVNGVSIFFERLFQLGRDVRALSQTKLAVIGAETRDQLRAFGLQADLMPERFTSEKLVEALTAGEPDFSGRKVLLPTSEIGRDIIAQELTRRGAEAVVVPIYQNLRPEYSAKQIDAAFGDGLDLVTFTSSSTVTNLVEILTRQDRKEYLPQIKAASIGPVTSETARQHQLSLALEAEVSTIEGLVAAILNHFQNKGTL